MKFVSPSQETLCRCAFTIAALCLTGNIASAHPLHLTRADLVINDKGDFTLTIDVDLVAQLLNASSGHVPQFLLEDFRAMGDDEIEGNYLPLRQRIERDTSVQFDGLTAQARVTFPDLKALRESADGDARQAARIVIKGHVPDGARAVSVKLPVQFAPAPLSVQVRDEPPALELLQDGEASSPIALSSAPAVAARSDMKTTHVAADYLVLGFEHILPQGLDHILFVLGLFLLSPKLKPLLWQVSAFTVAHSVSLALSMYGVVSLSPSIVEPLIAVSIVLIAAENVYTTQLKPWRPFVVFGFGLLHGLGFAGVLTELGLPSGHFVTALVSFNFGVEFGQLSVIALAFLVVGWFRNRTWYRAGVVVPASLCIAMVGAYWAVQRAFY